jgi:hypothetical protein
MRSRAFREGRPLPRRLRLVFIVTAISAVAVLGFTGADRHPSDVAEPGEQPAVAESAAEAPEPNSAESAERPVPKATRRADRDGELPPAAGREEVHAIAQAYPDRVEAVARRNGEWALRLDGAWFHWAGGRLLREELLDREEQYTPIRFYNYYRGPLRIRDVSPKLEARLQDILEERAADPPVRHPGFQDALYGISSQAEARRRMVEVEFFGHETRMHPLAAGALETVEAEIREASTRSERVAAFVRNLSAVEGFHWRNIAGTKARSFHSYGAAVDLIPRSYGGGFGYWRWAAEAGVEKWWELEEAQRFSVPQPIVDAFERHDFVWGGKWLFFDPIHFEYRPEVFLLSGED